MQCYKENPNDQKVSYEGVMAKGGNEELFFNRKRPQQNQACSPISSHCCGGEREETTEKMSI